MADDVLDGWADEPNAAGGGTIRRKRVRYEFWRTGDARWYGHRKVSGRVTDSFSYASRRSIRRAIRRRISSEK